MAKKDAAVDGVTPGHPRHPSTHPPSKRARFESVGELPDSQALRERLKEANLRGDFVAIKAIVDKFPMDIYEQGQAIKAVTDESLDTMDIIDHEVKEHRDVEGFSAMALSFSRVRAQHFDRLGLVSLSLTESISPKIELALSSATCSEINNFWKMYKAYISEETEDGLYAVGVMPEARSRWLIDTQIKMLVKYMRKSGLRLFVHPELTISSAVGKNARPVKVTNGNYMTILTGSVDYAPSLATDLHRIKTGDINNYLKAGNLQGLLNTQLWRASNMAGLNMNFLVIEAKKEEDGESGLEVHVPQVLAEALACLEKMAQEENDRTTLPWCLTDGIQWYFGVIIRSTNSPRTTSYRSPAISFNTNRVEQVRLKDIFTALIFWVITPTDTLAAFMKTWYPANSDQVK